MLARSIRVDELFRACVSFGPTSRTLVAAIVAIDEDFRSYFTERYGDLMFSTFTSHLLVKLNRVAKQIPLLKYNERHLFISRNVCFQHRVGTFIIWMK